MLDFNLLDDNETELFEIEEVSTQEIAIIGLSAQLPLVKNIGEFWDYICNGVDFISEFPQSRARDMEPFARNRSRSSENPHYFQGAYLDEIDKFDYSFFRLSPKEASLMTPNQRLFLQTAWKSIEDAGYCRRTLAGTRTGVYVGYNADSLYDYKGMIADSDPELLSMAISGNISSILAGRISYLLDLNGPSLCVDTACSSSLVAIHLACQAIRNQECELAIAGSVKINLLPLANEVKIGIESSSGRARSFDDHADGTGAGEGVISFVLKPLYKALQDGDAIHAVIKGSAVNQDGSSVGLTAPNVAAQEDVLIRAWDNAGIHPETISYMEAHGTGTKLGDPIEIAGIERAFRKFTSRKQFVAVGSVKSNVGHLDHAAGAMGLLKAILAMKEKQLPPLVHFSRPNRSIDFLDSPVYVNARLTEWEEGDSPRRCGVSAFGISGTNCHLVLEEAPAQRTTEIEVQPLLARPASSRRGSMLTLSAKNETALQELVGLYQSLNWGTASLAQVCYTAHTGRDHHEYRLAIVAEDCLELSAKLNKLLGLGSKLKSQEEQGIYYGSSKSTVTGANPVMIDPEGQDWNELAKQYSLGADIQWSLLYADQGYSRVHLPTYPFERSRCWLETTDLLLLSKTEILVPGISSSHAAYKVELLGGDQMAYSAVELSIAQIWGEVLGFHQLKVEDSFFELGGDSIVALKIVNRIRTQLAVDVKVADLFSYATLHELADFVTSQLEQGVSQPNLYSALLPASSREFYPLTSSQLRVFVQEQFGVSGIANNTPFCIMAEGVMDTERFNEAFRNLVNRHDSLRTSFAFINGEAVQQVIDHVDFQVRFYQSSADRIDGIVDEFIQPFDLSCPPLIRVGLVTLESNKHLIMIDMHHIIADGMSSSILLKEFCEGYKGIPLADLSIQYKDFAVWQQQLLTSGGLQTRKDYWTKQLSGELPVLTLPTDFPRAERKLQLGNQIRIPVNTELKQQLELLARSHRLTMNSLLFSLYTLLLHSYSKQDSLIIGTLTAGRNHPDLERVFGMFINFLPIRVHITPDMTFTDYLMGVNQTIVEAYAQDYPFDLLISDLQLQTDRSRNPLYDTMFVYHNEYKMNPMSELHMEEAGLTFTEYPLNRSFSPLDMKLDVWHDAADELVLVLEYDTGLFLESTATQMLTSLLKLAEATVASPEKLVVSLTARTFLPKQDELVVKESTETYPIAPSLQVAISATFTAEPLGEYVSWWSQQFNLPVQVNFAAYHQVFQELLHPSSLLASNDGINVLLARFEDWIRDDDVSSFESVTAKLDIIFADLVEAFGRRKKSIPYFIGIFPVSEQWLNNNELVAYMENLNDRWRNYLSTEDHVFVIEFGNEAADLYQVEDVYDSIMDQEGHVPFTNAFYAVIGTMIVRRLIAWRRQEFKVIVLDCDNTLWKGVCGESGPTGVEISAPYTALQSFMIERYNEGMLLAISSKNNEEDVWETFDRHPGMVLRKEHFTSARIHWGAKSTAVKELAEQLNVGLDSFIFVDDSAMECAEMMRNCPTVLTLQLPEDEQQIPAYLQHVWAFDKLVVTEEDRQRTAHYAAEFKRQDHLQQGSTTMEDFLHSLELQITMTSLRADQAQRAAQLTQRTNQFNMNTVRRTEEEMLRLISALEMQCWSIEVDDRFGEYGFVGLVIGRVEQDKFVLDTFLLSCRVLGRGVEQAILSELKRYAADNNIRSLEATYVASARNVPFREFLDTTGWEIGNSGAGLLTCRLPVERIPDQLAYISLLNDQSTELSIRKRQASSGISITETDVPQKRTESFALSGSKREITDADQRAWDSLKSLTVTSTLRHASHLLPLIHHNSERLLLMMTKQKKTIHTRKVDYKEPVTSVEYELVHIWEDILGIQPIGVMDHFFEIGGNSLQAVSLASRIHQQFHVQLSLRDFFELPTIRALAASIHRMDQSSYASIEPVQERDYYPVTSAQKRLLVLAQLEASDTAYNQPIFFQVEGSLDTDKFQIACKELVQRQEILRTQFLWHEDQFVQTIAPSVQFSVEFHAVGSGSVEEHITRFIRPFDLNKAPLFRVGVVLTDEQSSVLMFDMHHVISDGVSISLMIKQLMDGYQGTSLPELRIQYRDFAVWQQEQLRSEHMQVQERYWLETFADEVPVLNLPLDSQRPAVRGYAGHRLRVELDQGLYAAVQTLASSTGATPYMVFMAAYNVLLAKYAGQEDIVVGSPVAGRPHADLDQLIGMFVHTVVMRNKPSGQRSFRQFIGDVKETTLQALEHQDFPFEELVDRLAIQRDLSRNPLFDTMFVYQNMSWSASKSEQLNIQMYPHETHRSRFDLTLELAEYGDEIQLSVEYATELFHKKTMERMIRHYLNILKQITQSPDLLIGQIDMLDESEKARLLFGFNATQVEYEPDMTIQQCFEEQVQKTPDAIAAVYEGSSWSYLQLNNRANQLAMALRARGVKPNQIVGIQLERSLEMVAAVLGVLKAGAAYLPIDPEYPEERIQFMLEDSGTEHVITHTRLAGRLSNPIQKLYVDENNQSALEETGNLTSVNTTNDLAYVIYTSGSTGKPKGVMVQHGGMVNLRVYFQQKLQVTSEDKIIQFASFSFDASVWEMFMSLFSGAELHILAPETINNYAKLEQYVNEHTITIATLPPTYLAGLQPEGIHSLRKVITAGSASTLELMEKWRGKVQYINAYGPTESTICATAWVAPNTGEVNVAHSVSIGAPLPNTQIYIVNAFDQLQPIGIPGELCIGGAGLARGYLHRPELTEKQFISNPYLAGTRMYRTGDLARWLPNGTIEYLGRLDDQVKIRGYRIELGEVENCLMSHSHVMECIVTSRASSQGIHDLCAYIGTRENKLSIDEIRTFVSSQLPDYMVPAYFIVMEKLPLTSNGKVDKKSLPEPTIARSEGYESPTNVTEYQLTQMWMDILGVEKVGIKDHFFELGGHSLKAITLLTRIHKELGVELTLKQIFQSPTIEQLAKEIGVGEQTHYEVIPFAEAQSSYPLTFGQKKLYVLQQLEGVNTAYNIAGAYRIEGEIDAERLQITFAALVQRHEALRTTFAVEDGEFVQYIHETAPFTISYHEASEDQLEEKLMALIAPFDLSKAPLLRVSLIRLTNTNNELLLNTAHVLLIDMHHIISDGVSANILIRDFLNLYTGVSLPELRIQYKDYAVWQHSPRAMELNKQHEHYWLNLLSGQLPKLQLPTDFPRPAVQSYEGLHVHQWLDKEQTERLKAIAGNSGTTLYMVLLAGFIVLLSKYSGQEDIIVGTPSAGRKEMDVQPIIGMFVNTLVIRSQLYGQQSFMELLESVRENTISAFDHQDYPFDQLAEQLNLPRDISRNPLFDVMFILQNFDSVEVKADELSITPYPYKASISKFDMSLEIAEKAEGLLVNLEYAVKLYRTETANRMLTDYLRILAEIVSNPDVKLQDIHLQEAIVKRKNVMAKEIEFNF